MIPLLKLPNNTLRDCAAKGRSKSGLLNAVPETRPTARLIRRGNANRVRAILLSTKLRCRSDLGTPERREAEKRQRAKASAKKAEAEASRKTAQQKARAQQEQAQNVRSKVFEAARRKDAAAVKKGVYEDNVDASGGELRQGSESLAKKTPVDPKETLLHIAAKHGDVDLVQWLDSHGMSSQDVSSN